MDLRGLGAILNAIFKALLGLLLLPGRLKAWAFSDGGRTDDVDAEAERYRAAAAAVDASEPEERETLAMAIRRYLRREVRLGGLRVYGPEVAAWALAARAQDLKEADVPSDDARLEAHVLGRHAEYGDRPLVVAATLRQMQEAVRGRWPGARRQPTLATPAYAGVSMAYPPPCP